MNLYSKISLLALLAASSLIGMEMPPRLKAPAQSAAAQALNQPMIKLFSDTQQIDNIQRNYLEASQMFKDMLHDVGADHALVLPESIIEDYITIKDLLMYEFRLNIGTTDEKTIINNLKLKTEQQLVAIANACQRFELNKVCECAITLLTEKLNSSVRREKCLRDGSYNLNWTLDVAYVVAKKMRCSTLYWQIDPKIVKIANNLKPEQITILMEYYNKTDEMPFHLRDKLPQSIKKILFPTWWQRRSWLSKAAIITGGAAATGIAAWLGYKYFNK